MADFQNQLSKLELDHSALELQKSQNKEVVPQLDTGPNASAQTPQPQPVEVPPTDDPKKTEDHRIKIKTHQVAEAKPRPHEQQ